MALLQSIIYIYIWVLIISALLSWFPTTSSSSGLATIKNALARLTEPLLRPLRQILPRPRLGGVGIDLSVIVAVVLLRLLAWII